MTSNNERNIFCWTVGEMDQVWAPALGDEYQDIPSEDEILPWRPERISEI
jgi:hypothetical protein